MIRVNSLLEFSGGNAKTFHCIEFLKKVEEIKIFEILYQVQLKAYNSVALFNYRLFYSPLKSAKLFKMGHSNNSILSRPDFIPG